MPEAAVPGVVAPAAVAEPEAVVVAELEAVVVAVAAAVVVEPEAVVVAVAAAESAQAEAADQRAHSEADWIRATRSRRRNPLPASAARVRTMRQEVLPVRCSLHINACPLRRFRNSDGRADDRRTECRTYTRAEADAPEHDLVR